MLTFLLNVCGEESLNDFLKSFVKYPRLSTTLAWVMLKTGKLLSYLAIVNVHLMCAIEIRKLIAKQDLILTALQV